MAIRYEWLRPRGKARWPAGTGLIRMGRCAAGELAVTWASRTERADGKTSPESWRPRRTPLVTRWRLRRSAWRSSPWDRHRHVTLFLRLCRRADQDLGPWHERPEGA